LDRHLDHSGPVTGEDVVEGGGELAISVADEKPDLPGPLAEVHQEVFGPSGRRRPPPTGTVLVTVSITVTVPVPSVQHPLWVT
jgi:hypothetical protein